MPSPNCDSILHRASQQKVPTKLWPWLTAEGSLTALLEAKAGQPLQVQRTFEGYRLMTLQQKKQMGYHRYQLGRPVLAWVREVLLFGNASQPWVAAQSMFPLPSLQGNAKQLLHIKDMPIGYVLFDRQSSLPNHRQIYYNDTPSSQAGWCRQTIYHWQNRPIMISETFLQHFLSSCLHLNHL